MRTTDAAVDRRREEPAAAARGEPEEALPGDLQRLILDARQASADIRTAQAEYAYRLALVAQRAARGTLASRSSIAACAQALGIERQTLQPYALLAARWNPDEIRLLLLRRGANGRGLTASHLLALARLPKSSRDPWIERVFAEGIEAHDLRAHLRRTPARSADSNK